MIILIIARAACVLFSLFVRLFVYFLTPLCMHTPQTAEISHQQTAAAAAEQPAAAAEQAAAEAAAAEQTAAAAETNSQ